MKWGIVIDIPMMESKTHSKIDVSSSRNEVGKIIETKGVHGATTIDMPIMEAMILSKMNVSSLINVAG